MNKTDNKSPRIVAIGGGTGLPVVIKSLKGFTSNLKVIVSVADDGHSSGRLRKELGVLPPGDIRNCLTAMATNPNGISELFQFRFTRGELAGHSLGNLIITAMALKQNDFALAVKTAGEMLGCWGEVLPSTLDDIQLRAETIDGFTIEGQFNIATGGHRLKNISLIPENAKAYSESVQAIIEADVVIIGPGSLITSILPNLMISGISRALQETKARRIYFCNLMTQPGETDNLDARGHLDTLYKYTNENLVDEYIINTGEIKKSVLDEYAKNKAYPVSISKDTFKDSKLSLHLANLVDDSIYAHHCPQKIRNVLENIIPNGFFNRSQE